MPHLITVLAPGFEETEAVVFIDLLRRAQVEVTVFGLDAREVRGAHDITIVADAPFSTCTSSFDGIVLPGGMPGTRNLAASAALLETVRATHARKGLCAAICAAPIVLAKAGILKGVRATCFPGMEKEIEGAVVMDLPVVHDGNIITSKGVGTAIPFALELITYLMGDNAAMKVAAAIVWAK
jgi:protein deglycase